MRNQNIDQGWEFQFGRRTPYLSEEKEKRLVNLPHDYMSRRMHRERVPWDSIPQEWQTTVK